MSDTSVTTKKETTQFTCKCGAKWNRLDPPSNEDNCPDCGILVQEKQ